MTDRGGGALLLPYMLAGTTGSVDDDDLIGASACCFWRCFAQFELLEKLERDHVLKESKAEQCSFANHLVLQLSLLQTTMHQYER